MGARSDSRFGPVSGLFFFGAIGIALILAGMVYVPPYVTNREVQAAVREAARQNHPTDDNSVILSTINERLRQAASARYWVEADGQHSALDLQMKPENLTVTRDGNRGMSLDVHYTQEMLVPLLKKTKLFEFDAHADGPRTE